MKLCGACDINEPHLSVYRPLTIFSLHIALFYPQIMGENSTLGFCFCGSAATSRSSAVTVCYFSDNEILFARLCGILGALWTGGGREVHSNEAAESKFLASDNSFLQ